MSQLTTISLSKLILLLLLRCKKNPIYFIRKYCYVIHPTRGKVQFLLYDFQLLLIKSFVNHRHNIILKSRQMGITTSCAGYCTWLLLFTEDARIVAIANKLDTSKFLIKMIRQMYSFLPSWLQVDITIDNKQELLFSNRSIIWALSADPDAVRSKGATLLIFDEAAILRLNLAEDVWTAAKPSLSTGGSAIVLSTPKGSGNLFHRLWTLAESGKLENFNTTKLPWYLHPERDLLWRKNELLEMGAKKASQLYDCQFLASGNTVIDGLLIKLIQLKHEKDPLYKRSDGLWVWQLPVSDLEYQLEYFISADVGRGDSEDPSAFHIFNRRTLLQVALFSSIINTDKYAKTLVNVAQWYNNAILIVENLSIGWAVLQLIIRLGYENLYYDTTNPAYADQLRIQGRKLLDANGKQRLIPGFTTSPKTRPLIIDKLVKMFLSQSVIIHSKRTYAQLYTFIWSNGKPQAMSKYHDDLVMAMAIALWVRDTGLAAHLNSRIREETKLALFNSSINTSNIIPKTEQDQKLKLMNLEYNVMNLSFNLTELLDPRYRIARDKLLFMKNNK